MASVHHSQTIAMPVPDGLLRAKAEASGITHVVVSESHENRKGWGLRP
jgi:hypothetical protein